MRVGLAAHFVQTFGEIEWSCCPGGLMRHACGLQFNWVTDAVGYIFHCIDKAWSFHVCKQIDRKYFDVQQFSGEAFWRITHERCPKQKAFLQAVACGRHVTYDGLSHYSRKFDSNVCPLCKCADGKEHRIFHCNALKDIRKQFAGVIKWVRKQPSAVMAFGLVIEHDDPLLYKRSLVQPVTLALPNEDCHTQHVFTDGSSFFQDRWDCCIAGSSAVVVSFDDACWEPLCCEPLPYFDQSSFRAESFAILLTLQKCWRVKFYVDCAAVISHFHAMYENLRRGRPMPMLSHSDIWKHIWWHLKRRPLDSVVLIKVRAHVDASKVLSQYDALCAKFNDAADQLAKQAVVNKAAPVYAKMKSIVERRKLVEANTMQYHEYMCRINDQFTATMKTPLSHEVIPDFGSVLRVEGPLTTFDLPAQNVIDASPFGAKFTQRFLLWFSSVRWGDGAPTSGLELYVAFSMATKSQVPVLINKRYLLREDDVQADLKEASLATQSQVWLKVLKWFCNATTFEVQMLRCRSLHCFGYSYNALGFAKRATYPNMDVSCNALWHYFHGGGATTRNMHKGWCVQQVIANAGG